MKVVSRLHNILPWLMLLSVAVANTSNSVEIEQREYNVFVSTSSSVTGYRAFLYPKDGLAILHGDIAVPIPIPPKTIGIVGMGLPTSLSNTSNSVPSDFLTAFSPRNTVNHWGDFNGDGENDLFVYLPDFAPNRAYVIYGGDSALPSNSTTIVDNSLLYDFSTSTFSTRDVNGDGIPDIVLRSADGMEFVFAMGAEYGETYQEITSAMLIDSNELTATDVGITAGDFQVSPAGSVQYTIPVMTGASTGNVKPSVSLSYDSAGGNGIAGWGWNLNAGSTISRCRKKPSVSPLVFWEPISFSDRDAYCLDGQQLVEVSSGSGEYRTEIDSYRRIKRYGTMGSPTYWTVEAKDGSISYYGNTADSKQNLSSSGKFLSWALNRMQDSVGNYMDYEYTVTGNSPVLARIKYAGSASVQPSNSIEFEYSKRVDSSKSYIAGYEIASQYRLERIRSMVNGYELRSYHLNYLAATLDQTESLVSRLKSVQECVGAKCFEPTSFTWSFPKPSTMNFSSRTEVSNSSQYTSSAGSIDINGDGRRDLLIPRVTSQGHKILNKFISTGTGFAGNGDCRLHNDDAFDRYAVIDYNGDGHDDVIESSGDSRRWIVWPARMVGGVWTLDCPNFIDTGIPGDAGDKAAFSDFNGDGLLDMVYPVRLNMVIVGYEIRYLERSSFHGSAEFPYSYSRSFPITISSTGLALSDQASIKQQLQSGTVPSGTTYRYIVLGEAAKSAADFDGDGRADLIAPVKERMVHNSSLANRLAAESTIGWIALTSKNFSEFVQYHWIPAAFASEHIHTADFNGDGLTDLLLRDAPANQPFNWHVRINDGADLNKRYDVLIGAEIPGSHSHIGFFDMSGDGNTDIVALDGSGDTNVFSLTGSGFLPKTYQTNIATPGSPVWGDYNGDGLIDVVTHDPNSSDDDYFYLNLRGPGGIQQSVITKITNGFGAKTEISYLAMTDANVYTVGIGANQLAYGDAPVLDIMASSYLVSRVRSSAPAAGAAPSQIDQSAMAEVGYLYSGARLQGWGRGQLGFQKITTFDYQNNVTTETAYRQDFPFVGLPLSTAQRKMSGSQPLLSLALNDWRTVGTSTTIFRLNLLSATELSYDNDAAVTGATKLYKTVTTTKESIDTWGNPGMITVSTTGGGNTFMQVTENTYGTAENQRLGRLTAVKTTSTVNDAGSVTRHSSFEYYAAGAQKNLLWKEKLASESTTTIRETHYTYDSFGNKTRVTLKGSGTSEPDRYTRYVYSSDGRFLEQTYNGYEQLVEDVIARDSYGRATQVADIDGVSSYVEFDAFGREVERRRDFGITTTTSYNACFWDCAVSPYYVEQQSSDGSGSLVALDILGRETWAQTKTLNGDAVVVLTEYDKRSKVVRKSQPFTNSANVYWNQIFYDDIGRTLIEATAGAGVSNIVHQYGVVNFFGPDVAYHSVVNEKSQTTTTYLDALGREAIIYDALGGMVVNNYDALGNLTQVDLTSGGTTRKVEMLYNALGQRTRLIDPDKGTICFWYNVFGEEKKQARVTNEKRYTGSCDSVTAANSQTIETTYDNLGRATKKTYRNGASSTFQHDFRWAYDNTSASSSIGKLTQVQDAVGGYTESYSYDSVTHRPISTDYLLPDGQLFSTSVTYDSLGRVNTTTDAAGGTVQNTYDTFSGILESVRDVGSNKTYYEVTGKDAYGHTTTAKFTQIGATLSRSYSAETGRLQSVAATDVLATPIQNIAVNWDSVGNLTSRNERISSSATRYEYYCYDTLNRLIHSTTNTTGASFSCSGLATSSQTYQYDGFGNLVKNGSFTLQYQATGNAGPNAVTTAGSNTYSYDRQGNLLTDVLSGATQRSFVYNLMDKPTQVTQGSNSTQFTYGPSGSYFKRVDTRTGQPTTTTFYVGGIEIVRNATANTERIKRYITSDIVIEREENITTGALVSNRQYYLLRDHLGSVHKVIEPSTASAKYAMGEQMSFNAFGKRRDVVDYTALAHTAGDASYWSAITNNYTRRTSQGYTGHQEVDLGSPDQGLIHMGGRMYDPHIGRFLSADPIVQAPNDLQSYNRYAYVRNNPMVLTDPSGYSWWGEHVTPHGEQIVRTVAAIAITIATQGAAAGAANAWLAATTYAVGGYAAGYVATGSGQGGIRGALTAVATFGVMQAMPGNIASTSNLADWNSFNAMDFVKVTAASGIASGVIEDVSGGKFGHGFLSGFINGAANGPIGTAANGNFVLGTIASAVVGGTVSEVTGGKFANGAMSAAFAHLYGEEFAEESASNGEARNKLSTDENSESLAATTPILGSGVEAHNGGKPHVHWGNKADPRANAVNKDGTIRHGKEPPKSIKKEINKKFKWDLKSPLMIIPIAPENIDRLINPVPKDMREYMDTCGGVGCLSSR